MSAEVLRVDGSRPPSRESLAEIELACDRIEDGSGPALLLLRCSGSPAAGWTAGGNVGLVSKWERSLRRLERLPAATIAIADGDCGGPAFDAFLAVDHRIVTSGTRLLMLMDGGVPWPGMALYRLGRLGVASSAIRRMALFGVPLAAADALAGRLVDEVSDEPDAAERAGAVMAEFAGPDLTIRRQLMLDAATIGFEEALGAHLAACDRLLRGHAEALA